MTAIRGEADGRLRRAFDREGSFCDIRTTVCSRPTADAAHCARLRTVNSGMQPFYLPVGAVASNRDDLIRRHLVRLNCLSFGDAVRERHWDYYLGLEGAEV
jgi:hypothetical protein